MTSAREGEPFRAIVAVLTLIAGLGAAILGYFEYKAHQQDVRVERVLRYSDILRGQTEGYRQYGARLESLSFDIWRLQSEFGGQIVDPFVKRAVGDNPELREAVSAYTRFFDVLTICVAKNLCDEGTARALFIHDLREFHNQAYAWLTSEQEQYSVHGGKPLMCLHKHFRTHPAPKDPPFWQLFLPPGPCAESAE